MGSLICRGGLNIHPSRRVISRGISPIVAGLFFNSDDALVSKDIDGTWDVYEYEPAGVPEGEHACSPGSSSGSVVFKPARVFEVGGHQGEEGAGCVGLISSGESGQESAFLDASESGGDVFFMTTAKLAPQDFEHSYNVYECTTESPCIPNPPASPAECVTAETGRVVASASRSRRSAKSDALSGHTRVHVAGCARLAWSWSPRRA